LLSDLGLHNKVVSRATFTIDLVWDVEEDV
jgi:hypothetical protein